MYNPIRLDDTLEGSTEWSSPKHTYRFLNVAPNEWIVHRAHDENFVAHLRRDGNIYDFQVERGNPVTTGITVSLGEVEKLLP